MKTTKQPTAFTEVEQPKPLDFSRDKGSWRSKFVAVILVCLVVGWMGSGYIIPAETEEEPKTSVVEERRIIAVTTAPSKSQEVVQYFVAEGQAEPDRITSIRAESTGDITEVLVKKGDVVVAGQVIARFDVTQSEADLRRAQEELARAAREFDNAEQLVERGVATNDRLSQSRAALAAAEAGVTNATEMLGKSELTAPFGGRIEQLALNAGEFVSAGTNVGQIVDTTPLTVAIQVPQQSLSSIKAGQTTEVTFITGEVREGTVAFVGTNANASTRTFLAEITVANENGEVPSGVSAEVRIPIGKKVAHFLSPAILSLGSDGALGIKTVNDENVVEFTEISIERAQTDGIWVSGLDAEVNIITIGQGYVNDGETVDPQPELANAEES